MDVIDRYQKESFLEELKEDNTRDTFNTEQIEEYYKNNPIVEKSKVGKFTNRVKRFLEDALFFSAIIVFMPLILAYNLFLLIYKKRK